MQWAWQWLRRNIEGNLYEVRSAGATLRLYRNGVHHSQYNPNRPLGGSIWDLLVLPALHRPAHSIREALVLGFGAGAIGRLLKDLVGVERIVGVELDEIHLSIADGFFECSEGCELVAADAVEWCGTARKAGVLTLFWMTCTPSKMACRCAVHRWIWSGVVRSLACAAAAGHAGV